MTNTVATTLAYAVRILACTDRPDLQAHGDEIISSIETNYLPHGSGVDHGTVLDREKSTPSKLVFTMDYHTMDGNGSYAGWSSFEVTAVPSFETDLDLTVEGTDTAIFDTCSCFDEAEDSSSCDCQTDCDHDNTAEQEHGEGCIVDNDDSIAEMLAEDMSYCLSRVLTDEEYIGLSDLRAHMAVTA